MLTMNIKIDDLDMYKELCKQKASVEVGYFDDKVYEAVDEPFYSNVAMPNSVDPKHPYGVPRRFGRRKAVTARQVAEFNEYGGGHTPPRPFMRYTFDKFHKKWVRYVQDDLPITMDAKDTFGSLGTLIRGHISDTVKAWAEPPNAPATVMAKGFNNPLVDSGNMSEDFIEIKLNGAAYEPA